MKNIIKYLFSILIIQLFDGCAIQEIEFKRLENLKIDKVSPTPLLSMDMVYYNPNSVGAKLTSASVFVINDLDTIGIASFNKTIKLKAKDEFSVPITSIVSFEQLLKFSGKLLFNSQDLILNFNGTVTIKKFIFKKHYHFNEKQNFNSKNLF